MLFQRAKRNDSAETPASSALARRAQAGCAESFAALVERFHPRIVNMLQQRYGMERTAAEDLAQEAFAKAYRHLDGFDARYEFSTWIYTIARRRAIDSIRRRNRQPRQVPLNAGDEAPRVEVDPCAVLERREEAENVWRLAKSVLSEAQFTATWLRFADNCTVEEIAKRMGRSRIGVRVLLHRARSILVRETADDDAPSSPPLKREA